ncbi:MarR family transcriptional regulator [Paenarthrobacter sp. DKR-5]|uniref:MarR family winged helix-turn-helix transcriptional regulator n=1 Tax=Paenarthrobacter sp. DKR-5 TaxID=2835535 RepID=UPI0027DDEE12|nr:MarR family transcriptional regulator [Paenarthrobacter sp. DKR-5]
MDAALETLIPAEGGVPALAVELRIAVMRMSRKLRVEASGDAVTPGQYSVLAGLSQQGPLTLRQLADREHVQAPSMTRIVNALAELGFVTRSEHPTDGRQVLVHLSKDGRQTLDDARTRRTEWLAERLAALPPDEQDTLREATAILQRMSAK